MRWYSDRDRNLAQPHKADVDPAVDSAILLRVYFLERFQNMYVVKYVQECVPSIHQHRSQIHD